MTEDTSTEDTSPKYRVLERSLIGNEVCEAGRIVTLPAGSLPAENLEPLCDAGRAKAQEYVESNKVRLGKLYTEFPDPGHLLGTLDTKVMDVIKALASGDAVTEKQKAAVLTALEAAKPQSA